MSNLMIEGDTVVSGNFEIDNNNLATNVRDFAAGG